MDKFKILLAGIGGYGEYYLEEILENGYKHDVEIAGIVDPTPQNCSRYDELINSGIRIHKTMEDFYKGNGADLAVISSPIQFHRNQSCLAMSKGSGVLCEKPAAATVQDVHEMIDASERYGRLLAVGFQWSFSKAILDLKKDIQKGLLGRPVRLKTLVLWPRDSKYYSRSWAARIKSPEGEWILDSVAMNATAHYLHNMLFVLGKDTGIAAQPLSLKAELYRANEIENFDTAAARIVVGGNVELLYYATHAVNDHKGPVFRFEFENGSVFYDAKECLLKAVMNNGRTVRYGNPNDNNMNKLWSCVDSVKTGKPVPCTIRTALSHIKCINGMHESVPEIVEFDSELVKLDADKGVTYMKSLFDDLNMCYAQSLLPSEAGLPWAFAGKDIPLENYTGFPSILYSDKKD